MKKVLILTLISFTMFSFFKRKTEDIPTIWNRLEIWLTKNAPHLNKELSPPASFDNINKLEKLIKTKLPDEYINFLKIHNGQDRNSEGLIDTEELLSADRVIEEWSVWKELLDKGDFINSVSVPSKGVKSDWWNAKWIPITYDGSGNHYCIDLDPSSDGINGQIIRMWHDSVERDIIATSFKEWFSNYVVELENGNYVYSEDWGGIINKNDL